MKVIYKIAKSELSMLFYSPVAWLILVIFTFQTSMAFSGLFSDFVVDQAIGNLLWDVESITSTFFSPATSSFTIGGTSYVFRYTFDTSGMLISQEKTGEVVNYRR